MYVTHGKEARQQHRQRRHQGSRRGLGQITRPGPCDKARPPCHRFKVSRTNRFNLCMKQEILKCAMNKGFFWMVFW